ncbi:hypothetical protein CEXT_608621 [Caerostris extrusa]|uniref:Uncharacterized protein n=1 Tax=Caerostris extrusa TaxID=172846 RepID=A0AAV4R4F5_CAEEX|nr:hypothetical protein CEXT_608621 [Caerostris extrusa]
MEGRKVRGGSDSLSSTQPAFFVRSEIPPSLPGEDLVGPVFVLKLVIESNDAVENGGANHPATHRHFIYRLLRMQLSKSARTVIRNG